MVVTGRDLRKRAVLEQRHAHGSGVKPSAERASGIICLELHWLKNYRGREDGREQLRPHFGGL